MNQTIQQSSCKAKYRNNDDGSLWMMKMMIMDDDDDDIHILYLGMKKGVTPSFPPLCGIEQNDRLTLLGVTLQNDCKVFISS